MIRPVVRNLLDTTSIDLYNGAGIPEIVRTQEHLNGHKITVYQGLASEDNDCRTGRLP